MLRWALEGWARTLRKVPILGWVLIAGSACQSESLVECICTSPGLTITANGAEIIQQLAFAGPACTAPEVTSRVVDAGAGDGFIPGAPSYSIMPNAEGDCTVTVLLSDGTSLEQTVRFQAIRGRCCPGLYVADGSSYWSLPSPFPADGGID